MGRLTIVFWFFVIVLAIIFALMETGCYQVAALDAQNEDEESMALEYPTSNWGWKATVRELDGKYVNTKDGDTLPDFCLPSNFGSEICMSDLYYSDFDYAVINMSIKNCSPCIDVYLGLPKLLQYFYDNGHHGTIIHMVGDADVDHSTYLHSKYGGTFLYDETKEIVSKWQRDSWPEVTRGYPSLVFVDLLSMKIVSESLGFVDHEEWFEKQLKKFEAGL